MKFTCELPLIAPAAARYGEWDGKNWRQLETWRAEFSSVRVTWSMVIHPGFVTDGGSIPQRLQGHFSPLGFCFAAYLVHDGLYGTHYVDRPEADLVMCEIMEALGVGRINRNLQWAGVRAAGWTAWNKPAELIEHNRRLIEWHREAVK